MIRRITTILTLVAVLTGIGGVSAQAGDGVHIIHSSRFSETSFVVIWQKPSLTGFYTDGISPGQTEGEHRAQNGNAEPWAVRIAPGKCARFAFQNVPYGEWHCASKVRWPNGRVVRVNPGQGYGGNWQTIVQYRYR